MQTSKSITIFLEAAVIPKNEVRFDSDSAKAVLSAIRVHYPNVSVHLSVFHEFDPSRVYLFIFNVNHLHQSTINKAVMFK